MTNEAHNTGNTAQPKDATLPHYGTTERVTKIRATIARRMKESLQGSAQLTATVEVDLSNISALRKKQNPELEQQQKSKISYLSCITHAAVQALKQYPKLNASIDLEAGHITYPEAENIGVAVDTPRGLVVPVIKNCGSLSSQQIAAEIAGIATRSREGKLTATDLSGGTFTVTNYGSVGTLWDTPIVNLPQVAILGTGSLQRRPVAVTDREGRETIAIRDMMYLSLSYDHQLVDGADAARFLTSVKDQLEAAL